MYFSKYAWKFSYLEFSLIAILSFVGLKMLLHEFIEIPEWASLVLLPFSFGRIFVSLRMNKLKNEKETQ
jgi:tellurite resistance protein TerC